MSSTLTGFGGDGLGGRGDLHGKPLTRQGHRGSNFCTNSLNRRRSCGLYRQKTDENDYLVNSKTKMEHKNFPVRNSNDAEHRR